MTYRASLRRKILVLSVGTLAVVLMAVGLALTMLDRMETDLTRMQADSARDVQRVLKTAEVAAALPLEAKLLGESDDETSFALAHTALDERLAEFAALARDLPSLDARGAAPTLVPSIVRLSDRLEGISRHLMQAVSDGIETRAVALSDLEVARLRQRFLMSAAMVAVRDLGQQVRNYAEHIAAADQKRIAALADYSRMGKIGAILVGVVVLAIGATVVNRILQRMAADLASLTRAMQQLAEGDMNAHPRIRSRQDEIGTLASAFRVFRDRLIEREQMERKLQQAERMEAIGRFTGGIAHDFNNILTAIGTNLQLIQDTATDPDAVRRRSARALEATGHGADMIKHLLTFGRHQTTEPKATDVDDVILSLINLVEASFSPEIQLTYAWVGTGRPRTRCVLVDSAQMENSLINLLFNARDAMGSAGRIDITSTEIDGNFIRISISDNGCGMPAEVLDHIFEPFFSTKGGGRGIGLGMSTVYGFINQSGGRIEILSEVGKGTTVHLDLPCVPC